MKEIFGPPLRAALLTALVGALAWFLLEPPSLDGAESLDFIELLNGHPIEDTAAAPFGVHPGEAPGSRANGAALADGTMYVSLYADA